MKQFLTVFKQQLRLQRLSLIVWTLVMTLVSYGAATSAGIATDNSAATKLVKNLNLDAYTGGSPDSFPYPADWFINMKLLGWFLLFIGIYISLTSLAIVSREEENHTAEFVLSMPLAKNRLLLARFAGSAAATAVIYAVSLAAIAAGLNQAGLDASLSRYAVSFMLSYSLTLTFGALSLFISMLTRSYGKALKWSMGLISALFLYDLGLRFASPDLSQGAAGKLTPFGWYNTIEIVKNGDFPWIGIVYGIVTTGIFLFLSIRLYDRRELV